MSTHVSNERDAFSSVDSHGGVVRIAGGQSFPNARKGTVTFKISERKKSIPNILYVLGITKTYS